MEKTLQIEGMMCGHCEAHVKKAPEGLEAVTQANVSHETGTAVVTPPACAGQLGIYSPPAPADTANP